ncbi:hypothetical protein CMO92_00445 [Candidatus Woesearchaeota archaeon]|nr:hypothetical protein [Candidatus Woesearchaeota archaeon]
MRVTRITIVRRERPERDNINDKLQWFGGSIGLFNQRDRDKSCFRIFITLLRSVKRGGMTSDELAEDLGLSRGTVVHHLKKLRELGLVVGEGNRYRLEVNNLVDLVQNMQDEIKGAIGDLKVIAGEIDKQLRL